MSSSTRTARFQGVIPPVITPLTADLEVDIPSLERLTARLIEQGCSGLFILGSSGEAVYLTDRRRDQVLDVVSGVAAGQIDIVAGCIETTTARVIDRARAAQARGVAGIVTTAPFYTLVGPHEVERHFRAVHAAVDLPQLAYDIPVCVHTKLSVDLLLRLAADGVVCGVKDSSGDDVAFRQLVVGAADAGLAFSALTGHELVVDAMMLAGGDGAVPGLGNVDPAGYVRLDQAARAGDWAAAKAEQDRLVRLFRIVDAADPATTAGSTRGVGAFKTALQILGVISTNAVSLPMRPLDEREAASVRGHLEVAGLC